MNGIRVKSGNNVYRVFCFFDDFDIIVLGDGFQKKTPQKEIDRAIKLRKEYYYEKK